MQSVHTPSQSDRVVIPAVSQLLREARRLHRAARSDALTQSLPVLRRLLRSQSVTPGSLPELHRRRHSVQRKHVLRMLAREAGHPGWEAYRHWLERGGDGLPIEHFDIAGRHAGHLNLWFSTPEAARSHAAVHGGRPIRVGDQAVLLLGGD